MQEINILMATWLLEGSLLESPSSTWKHDVNMRITQAKGGHFYNLFGFCFIIVALTPIPKDDAFGTI